MGRLPTPALIVSAAALLGALLSVARLRLRVPEEKRVWQLMLLGVAIIAVAALAGQGAALIPGLAGSRPASLQPIVFSIGCILSCGVLYQALVHWNRSRTRVSDPSELLNGLSAVLVGAAILNLALRQTGSPLSGLAQVQLQASVLATSALVVVLGTATSVAVIGGLIRDRRIWLITLALSVLTGVELMALISSAGTSASALLPTWLLAGGLIASCALIAPDTAVATPRVATSQAVIIGALLVQVQGFVLLAVAGRLEPERRLLVTGYALAGVCGASVRVLQLIRDLAHLTQTRHQALTDELTGIPNRRALLLALDDVLLRARSASLLIVDLDRFKEINDRHGHAAGDRLLRHTASVFAAHTPAGGLLSRLGGDEFAVLLTDVADQQATELAERLARASAAPLSDLKGGLLQVGASIGVATVDLPGVDGGELLRRADIAMYQAKTSGSGVRRYDGALDAAARERRELMADFRSALNHPADPENQVQVHFQPQLSARTGQVVGAEALVRWRHARLGLLGPDRFLDLVEQSGLIRSLTEHVLRTAAEVTAAWRANGHRLRVSVNLSRASLVDEALLPLIDEILASGIAACDLVLEVADTGPYGEPGHVLAAFHRIAARNVGISIDHYGTGYTSLSCLNELPAAELKLDRSFTARVVSDPRAAAIVAGTVELARHLELRLIAEGIEDDATLAMITDLGCDESQGYLHGRPMPADDFLRWLDARPTAQRAVPGVPTRV